MNNSVPRAFELCMDFGLFPDDMPVPSPWIQGGMTFTSFGNLFINQSGGNTGLQFEDVGLTIQLPTLVTELRLVLGAFKSPVTLKAMDPSNNVVTTLTIPANNTYDPYQVTGSNIRTLRLSGGGNEGILNKICFDACGD